MTPMTPATRSISTPRSRYDHGTGPEPVSRLIPRLDPWESPGRDEDMADRANNESRDA